MSAFNLLDFAAECMLECMELEEPVVSWEFYAGGNAGTIRFTAIGASGAIYDVAVDTDEPGMPEVFARMIMGDE